MASQFFAGLTGGAIVPPDALINVVGPHPSLPSWAPPQIRGIPDGSINRHDTLVSGGVQPYAYGANPARISTQTQLAHPNKVQLVIPRLFIPAAQCTAGCVQDPILEHATTDGDLVFSLKMNLAMQSLGRQYAIIPYGNSTKSMKLVNLATVNFLLWGMQVGTALGEGRDWRWKAFFSNLCMGQQKQYEGGGYTAEIVWNFLQTYLVPFGVQHGSDRQGGGHEGKSSVSSAATEYVSAFAVEGKIRKINNLWRCHDIDETDDLVLELTYLPPQQAHIPFHLCASVRATRTEYAPVPLGWWYLNPVVLKYKTLITAPHLHIGRSQKLITGYTKQKWGTGHPAWDARASAVGMPAEMTFEPDFVESDLMLERRLQTGALRGQTAVLGGGLTQRQLADVLPEAAAHAILFADQAAVKRLQETVRRREQEAREAEAAKARAVRAAAGSTLPRPIAIGAHAAATATSAGPRALPPSSAAALAARRPEPAAAAAQPACAQAGTGSATAAAPGASAASAAAPAQSAAFAAAAAGEPAPPAKKARLAPSGAAAPAPKAPTAAGGAKPPPLVTSASLAKSLKKAAASASSSASESGED